MPFFSPVCVFICILIPFFDSSKVPNIRDKSTVAQKSDALLWAQNEQLDRKISQLNQKISNTHLDIRSRFFTDNVRTVREIEQQIALLKRIREKVTNPETRKEHYDFQNDRIIQSKRQQPHSPVTLPLLGHRKSTGSIRYQKRSQFTPRNITTMFAKDLPPGKFLSVEEAYKFFEKQMDQFKILLDEKKRKQTMQLQESKRKMNKTEVQPNLEEQARFFGEPL